MVERLPAHPLFFSEENGDYDIVRSIQSLQQEHIDFLTAFAVEGFETLIQETMVVMRFHRIVDRPQLDRFLRSSRDVRLSHFFLKTNITVSQRVPRA